MTEDEVRKLRELATRLGSTPRRVLAQAASLHDAPQTGPAVLSNLRRSGKTVSSTEEQVTDLLLTPVADHAKGEVDDVLAVLWPKSRKGDA